DHGGAVGGRCRSRPGVWRSDAPAALETRAQNGMRIGVPAETMAGERRVALVPDAVKRLTKAGVSVAVQRGAGVSAGFADSDYESAGAEVAPDAAQALAGADLICRVQQPDAAEIDRKSTRLNSSHVKIS